MIKTYSELITLPTFHERFQYLKLSGNVGVDTFGYDRYLNQQFYKSAIWRRLRDQVILRDMGCDMAHPDFEIVGPIIVHHLNPITKSDVLEHSDYLLNPDFLVCVSDETHKAIHYGDESLLLNAEPVIRRPFDTCPWR